MIEALFFLTLWLMALCLAAGVGKIIDKILNARKLPS